MDDNTITGITVCGFLYVFRFVNDYQCCYNTKYSSMLVNLSNYAPPQMVLLIEIFNLISLLSPNFITIYLCRFKLPSDRLWISVFEDDEEAFSIWHDVVSSIRSYLFYIVILSFL